MEYKNYKQCRNLSWEILIGEGVTALPVKMAALCKGMGIVVKSFDTPNEQSGYCTIIKDIPYIFYSSNISPQRARFTIAHELGHILLGHVGKYQLVNREPSPGDNPIEQAANSFAARILAPACILWGCNVQSAADIMLLCDISKQAAEYRWERMQRLYQRNKFLISPLERKVYNQFQPFINYRLRQASEKA